MATFIRSGSISNDTAMAGSLKTRTLGISQSCYVELMRSASALVLYRRADYTRGQFFDLARVQLVSFLQLQQSPHHHQQRHGFRVKFCDSQTLVFYCTSHADSVKWIEAIQELCRNCAVSKPIDTVRVYVQLLPCRNIRFSGVCQLTVSAQTVQLRAAVDDESERQVEPARPLVQWPVSSIRHCGYSDKLLLLRTTESCETKSGEFMFFVQRPFNAGDVCKRIFAAMTAGQTTVPQRNTSTRSTSPDGPGGSDGAAAAAAGRESTDTISKSQSVPNFFIEEPQPTAVVREKPPPIHLTCRVVHPVAPPSPTLRISTNLSSLPSPCTPCPCTPSSFHIQLPIQRSSTTEKTPPPRTPTKHANQPSMQIIPVPSDDAKQTTTAGATTTPGSATTTPVVLEESPPFPAHLLLGLESARCALVRLTRSDGEETAAGGDDGGIARMGEFPAGCGVLLYGPPGCGKWSLGRWFAAECRSRLVSIDCRRAAADRLSDHLSTALDVARSGGPSCVVYLADVDAVSDADGLAKITAALDAVDCARKTMMIAATCFPDGVDASLTTPGRFSEQIYVAPPDEATRRLIVNERLDELDVSEDCAESVRRMAAEVPNATPSVLVDLCARLSALLAVRSPSSATPSPPTSEDPPPAVGVRQKPLDDAVAEAKRQVVAIKDSMEACAANWIDRNRRDGWFVVEAEGDEWLERLGVFLLGVDVDAVKIYELNAAGSELCSWPIGSIRRFGCEPLRFTVETGRSCPNGEGKYTLKTTRAEDLRDYMLSVTKRC